MTYSSSTLQIIESGSIPKHIAIVMDGNGRWAKSRMLPRIAGHKRGVAAVRQTVQNCIKYGVEDLTLFAFSSENWRRPAEEVSLLMRLFLRVLRQDILRMHEEGIKLTIVGDTSRFSSEIREAIEHAETLTVDNKVLRLNVAANYGGRWDILQATKKMLANNPLLREAPELISEEKLLPYLSLSDRAEPDLFIRTGGEQRVSNFLIWQMAYTELYFTDTFWPDFDEKAFSLAINSYNQRERRFGRTSEQVQQSLRADAS